MAISLPALAQQPSPAPAPPATPQVVVLVNLRSKDVTITDIKFRAFYNKIENKVIPLTDYDLKAAIQDEVMTTLAQDKRVQWRLATPEDGLDGMALADDKQRTPAMLTSLKGDRVLVVDVYGVQGYIHSLVKNMVIGVNVIHLDRDGRKLWKKGVSARMKFPGSIEESQADNQKGLKQAINTLIEKLCENLKSKVAEQKI
ncbi:MAG: hypothetical protein M3O85_02325 [Acidobacteriota bacterium]|nr:hypothetical protein [Acidobacteriota bacterium]